MHQRVCLANVPVLVFHSVRRHDLAELGDLSLEEAVFDRQLAALARGGYRSITCAQLSDHLERGERLPKRPVLLTFDDGYLDNFTIAGPVLRRHGFSATVFVASDYVDGLSSVRATSETARRPDESGYVSAGELRAMEASGAFEIQAHSAAHARVPIAPEVVDFHRPAAPCRWLVASRFAELRARAHTGEHDGQLAWGAPVWRSGWMGEARAFAPDGDVEQRLTAHVAANGGPVFFARDTWKTELERIAASAPMGGRFESESEQRARLALDLTRSRTALEGILGHAVPFMAWPGGGSSALAIDVALREAGFRATFGTNRTPAGVVPGPSAIPRTYFNQRYRGRFSTAARVWKLRGVADYESGRVAGYARVLVANRLMQIGGSGPG
jgi:peptidoglycan/xylan/chitin deacetylase (PgdA/CDA1 family)